MSRDVVDQFSARGHHSFQRTVGLNVPSYHKTLRADCRSLPLSIPLPWLSSRLAARKESPLQPSLMAMALTAISLHLIWLPSCPAASSTPASSTASPQHALSTRGKERGGKAQWVHRLIVHQMALHLLAHEQDRRSLDQLPLRQCPILHPTAWTQDCLSPAQHLKPHLTRKLLAPAVPTQQSDPQH